MVTQQTRLIYVTAMLDQQKAEQDQHGGQVYTWIASTARPDDNGNIFDLEGWDLAAYRKNPVVLTGRLGGHDWDGLPVAKATEIHVDQTKQALVARIVFAPTPAAKEVQSLVDGGFLSALSVGALPIEYEPRYDPTSHRPIGIHYHRQTLRELSLVPIPANTDAIRIASFLLADQQEAQAILETLRTMKETPLWTPQPLT